MKEENNKGRLAASRKPPGRKQAANPKVFRCSIRFDEQENARFISLFEQSKLKSKTRFITSCIFDKPIKLVNIDKSSMDICAKLSETNAQIRSIGVNYNQITKALKLTFGEKKALAFLYKLEKATIDLVALNKKIIFLIEKYEAQWLQK